MPEIAGQSGLRLALWEVTRPEPEGRVEAIGVQRLRILYTK